MFVCKCNIQKSYRKSLSLIWNSERFKNNSFLSSSGDVGTLTSAHVVILFNAKSVIAKRCDKFDLQMYTKQINLSKGKRSVLTFLYFVVGAYILINQLKFFN